jgi:hypothetical protein
MMLLSFHRPASLRTTYTPHWALWDWPKVWAEVRHTGHFRMGRCADLWPDYFQRTAAHRCSSQEMERLSTWMRTARDQAAHYGLNVYLEKDPASQEFWLWAAPLGSSGH